MSDSVATSSMVNAPAQESASREGAGPHLGAVDGFRALACLMVVSHHCFVHANKYNWPMLDLGAGAWNLSHLLSLGYIGVEFFFVISGFCLFYPICRKWNRDVDWASYAKKRLWRIYPAYLVVLGLLIVLHGGAPLKHWILGGFFIATVLNASFWTLCLEARWYCVFPVIVHYIKRWGFAWVGGISILVSVVFKIIGVLGVIPLFVPAIVWLKIGPLPIYLPIFVFGMWVAYHFSGLSDALPKEHPRFLVFLRCFTLLAVVGVLALVPKLPPIDFHTYWRVVPAGIAGGALLLSAL